MSKSFPPCLAGAATCLILGVFLIGGACRKVDRSAPVIQTPQIIVTNGGVEMVRIPGGRFTMGSDRGEPDQGPAHEVEIAPFWMDRYEVTQAVYAQMDPVNGSHFKGLQLPTEMIGWGKAALYCNLRSEAEGLEPCYNEFGECNFEADGYRLPTEAEWEYACRAGSGYTYSFGSDLRELDRYAWYAANSAKKTHPVGNKKPNAWGLFDMHGNVAEWCNDFYDPKYYQASPGKDPRGPAAGDKNVLRGGHWGGSAATCGSAVRFGEEPGFSDACFSRDAIGFRCVRKAPREITKRESPSEATDEPPPPAEKAASRVPMAGVPAMFALAGTPLRQAAENTKDTQEEQPAVKTGFVYGDIYLQHDTGKSHPEKPERLTAIVERLKQQGLLTELLAIQPRPAAEEWLTAVHTPAHVAKIRRLAEQGGGYAGSMDTPVSPKSYTVAVEAVGGVLAAVDAVMEGKVRNAFCAVRPPGHHASQNRAMGFCLLNNVAIAARYAQQKHKLSRVLIVDWDVHHGNGTQAIFYDDPSVFYFSVHQYPFYPGTGSARERGEGKGQGTTLNVPLEAGCGDREFKRALEEKLVPAADEFKPDFVLISAGFDAHRQDLLGGMKVTAEGFAHMTRIVERIAVKHCRGRLVSVLEGGYGLEGLAASVEAHLESLMD